MPDLLVTHPAHFLRGPDGCVWTTDTFLGHGFWSRYLKAFDRLGVAARVRSVNALPDHAVRSDGPQVQFHDLPDYLGPWQYAMCRTRMKTVVRTAVPQYQAYCLRVPCAIATLVWHELRRLRRPYALEVTGDPQESLGPGGARSVLRPLARWSTVRGLKAQCGNAAACAYVTRESLQKRYPPSPGTFTTYYSSLEMPRSVLVDAPRDDFHDAKRLVFVGTLAVKYKAPDILIQAIASLARPDLHLTMLGDGRIRPEIEKLAGRFGVASQIEFAGWLPAGEPVRQALDNADLFVLPSRTEGLPRAMIEAMGRSLPCIGTAVGGIPELLEPQDLVPPDDANALATKIAEFLDDPERMARAARRNLETAREYVADVIEQRRNRFYQAMLEAGSAT